MSCFSCVARDFLRASGMPVHDPFIKNRMESHPDYPALISLTDTLDEIGISYQALRVQQESVYRFQPPLLIHLEADNQFEIIHSFQRLTSDQSAALSQWNGILVRIENNTPTLPEYNNLLRQRQKAAIQNAIAFVLLATVYSYLLFLGSSVASALLSLTCLAGLVICFSIFQLTINKNTFLTQKVCSSDTAENCQSVLKSKVGMLWGGITLGDIGLIYFGGQLLYMALIAVSGMVNTGLFLLSLACILSLLFSFFSIYYQKFVLRSWCGLCLSVLACLWLQGFILAPFILNTSNVTSSISVLAMPLVLFLLSLSTTTAVWLLIKSFLVDRQRISIQELSLLKWKRDPQVFQSLLSLSRVVESTPWPDDLTLGDSDAPVQVLVVSNPFCGPCVANHKKIEQMLMEVPGQIGITFRFVPDDTDPESEKNRVISKILAASKNMLPGAEHPIHFWFKTLNEKKLTEKFYLPQECMLPDLIARHSDWCRENYILETPSLFVNGHEFPQQYRAEDIRLLLPFLPELLPRLTPRPEMA